MFENWENFYILIGGAAGALIGLMFVVTTLTAGRDPAQVSRGAPVYVTPVVFHFAVVMVISAIAEMPGVRPAAMGAVLAVAAAIGLPYAIVTTRALFRPGWPTPPDMSDRCFYGVFPALAYLAIAAAAAATWLASGMAAHLIGLSLLILLLIGIRNAWDLATTLAQQR